VRPTLSELAAFRVPAAHPDMTRSSRRAAARTQPPRNRITRFSLFDSEATASIVTVLPSWIPLMSSGLRGILSTGAMSVYTF